MCTSAALHDRSISRLIKKNRDEQIQQLAAWRNGYGAINVELGIA
jgi:hypothetical protein